MALIHRWPLVPSLNNSTITLDVVGGLSTTNNGDMTQSDINGMICSYTGAEHNLAFTKTLPAEFSLSCWIKYASGTIPNYDDPFSVNGCTTPAGWYYTSSNTAKYRLTVSGSAYTVDCPLSHLTLLRDAAWHMIVVSYKSGTLKGSCDNLEVSVSSIPQTNKTSFLLGGVVCQWGKFDGLPKRFSHLQS